MGARGVPRAHPPGCAARGGGPGARDAPAAARARLREPSPRTGAERSLAPRGVLRPGRGPLARRPAPGALRAGAVAREGDRLRGAAPAHPSTRGARGGSARAGARGPHAARPLACRPALERGVDVPAHRPVPHGHRAPAGGRGGPAALRDGQRALPHHRGQEGGGPVRLHGPGGLPGAGEPGPVRAHRQRAQHGHALSWAGHPPVLGRQRGRCGRGAPRGLHLCPAARRGWPRRGARHRGGGGG